MTPEQLAAIRERAQQATPGPWIVQRPGREVWQTEPYAPGPALVLRDEHIYEPNAVFIAHAREDVPTLLDLVDTLTARLAVVRKLHQERPNSTSALYPNPLCSCGKEYPCPTIRAIDGD